MKLYTRFRIKSPIHSILPIANTYIGKYNIDMTLCEGNGFIMAEKNASFIQIWRSSYINFDHTRWSDHSTVMPLR